MQFEVTNQWNVQPSKYKTGARKEDDHDITEEGFNFRIYLYGFNNLRSNNLFYYIIINYNEDYVVYALLELLLWDSLRWTNIFSLHNIV